MIDGDEARVNDEVAAELPKDTTLYQRGGDLVRVIVEEPPENGPRLSRKWLRTPSRKCSQPGGFRDLISRRVSFFIETKDGPKPQHPPAWSVAAVGSRGSWPGVRPLTGVVSFPVVRHDGTIPHCAPVMTLAPGSSSTGRGRLWRSQTDPPSTMRKPRWLSYWRW